MDALGNHPFAGHSPRHLHPICLANRAFVAVQVSGASESTVVILDHMGNLITSAVVCTNHNS